MAYNKKTWKSDEVITKGALNNMEDGIAAAHTAIAATNTNLAGKQDALTPGSGITITDNTIAINAAHASGTETTAQKKPATVGKVQELIGEGRRVEPITSAPATLDQSVIYFVHGSSSDITFGSETVPSGTTAHVYHDGNGWVAVANSGTPTSEAIMAALEDRLDTAGGEGAGDATIPTTAKVGELISNAKIMQGYYSNANTFVHDDHFVTFVAEGGGAFYASFTEDVYLYEAHLADERGCIICYQYIGRPDTFSTKRRHRVSRMLPNNVKLVCTVFKNSNWETSPMVQPQSATETLLVSDNPLATFDYLQENFGNQREENAKKRAKNVAFARWVAKRDIVPADRDTPTQVSSYCFKKGRTYLGVPYSDNNEHGYMVGKSMSINTWLSAMGSKHSVCYEDRQTSPTSSPVYGYDGYRDSSLSRQFFGLSCNLYASYVVDLPFIPTCDTMFTTQSLEGMEKLTSIDDVAPMDFLVSSGHVEVLLDIVNCGDKTYYIVTEQTPPYTIIEAYSEEDFASTFSECVFFRPIDGRTATKDGTKDYVYGEDNEVAATQLGNYATFKKGDPIFINIRKFGNNYPMSFVLEKMTNGEYNEVSTFTHEDATQWGGGADEDNEVWERLELPTSGDDALDAGLYRVRLVTNNPSEYDYGSCYFEVIGLTLSIEHVSGNKYKADFTSTGSVTNGRVESISGFQVLKGYYSLVGLTSKEINNSSYVGKYFRVYAKGVYGYATARVLIGG